MTPAASATTGVADGPSSGIGVVCGRRAGWLDNRQDSGVVCSRVQVGCGFGGRIDRWAGYGLPRASADRERPLGA